ncbi:selenide, water dikinase SelD [Actinomadura sp. WMMA1423]|uniref:selenide, water dikinase SelD n=1 Tax=Actinomadura sp. WMMA1423 TaxID=2591108 RepID=UPI00143D7F53|nr:selenide, water dikinase SelD [Actinomadura sp. WMMA1423]
MAASPESRRWALADYVSSGGCAGKIDAQSLDVILAGSEKPARGPVPVVGLADRDDAAVLKINENLGSVVTVDVIPPPTGDAFDWGWVAAANALSDVFAMGGVPQFALSVLGMPAALGTSVARAVIDGALACLSDDCVTLVGGHSIKSETPFFGLSVHGSTLLDRIWRKAGAQPEDVILLTRPLGFGVLLSALRNDPFDACADELWQHLKVTNRTAAEILREYDVHAATDVTGFGLAIQISDMARASAVSVHLDIDRVPVLPTAVRYAEEGIVTSLTEANRRHSANTLTISEEISSASGKLSLIFDPQTNGGLLVALPERDARNVISRLLDAGLTQASIVGRVATGDGHVVITTS